MKRKDLKLFPADSLEPSVQVIRLTWCVTTVSYVQYAEVIRLPCPQGPCTFLQTDRQSRWRWRALGLARKLVPPPVPFRTQA